LTAVLLEGIVFLLLTFFNVREAIINCIPMSVKHAISVGIGLFIAFIGLSHSQVGVIVSNPATVIGLGDVTSGGALLALIGILITGALLARNVKGALLIGILATTIIGIPMNVTPIETFEMANMFKIPSLKPILFQFEFAEIFSFDMFLVLFTFLFVDMFDTVGTLIGVSDKAGMLDKDGKVPNAKKALFADAIGTTVGAMLGTSTVTTYVESASGVAEGGRTGLTALTTGFLFLASLLIAPIFLLVPAAATAPALVLVGLFMMSPIKKINFDDFTESIPAFVTIIMMPFGFSIAHGIVFGILSYVIVKVLAGKAKDVNILTFILFAIFIGKFILDAFNK